MSNEGVIKGERKKVCETLQYSVESADGWSMRYGNGGYWLAAI